MEKFEDLEKNESDLLKKIVLGCKSNILNFITELGMDSEIVEETLNPCVFIIKNDLMLGNYNTPGQISEEEIIEKINNKNITSYCGIKNFYDGGCIFVARNKDMDTMEIPYTIVHEMIHNMRNLLVHDAVNKDNTDAYIVNGEKIDQMNDKYDDYYADASQNIVKGNIDTSRGTISKYKNMTNDELEDIEFSSYDKLDEQTAYDETLVELMTILIFQMGDKFNLKEALQKVANEYPSNDIKYMAKLILSKPNGIEVFKWMIDPLSYSDDIHYDFLNNFFNTEEDKKTLNFIYDQYLEQILEEDNDLTMK